MSANKPFSNMIWNKTASRIQLTRIGRVFILLVFVLSLVGGSATSVKAATRSPSRERSCSASRKTPRSRSISCPPRRSSITTSMGLLQGAYTGQTAQRDCHWRPAKRSGHQRADCQHAVLLPDALPRAWGWTWMMGRSRTEHSFWTQRAPGSTFTFTVTSDSHANFNNPQTQQAADKHLARPPDFHFDLGDTFHADGDTNSRPGQSRISGLPWPLIHGSDWPFGLRSSSHPEITRTKRAGIWMIRFSIALASIQARKLYFPTPINDGFYSGNTDTLAAINAGDLRRPVPRGLLRLDMGRCAVRGHRSVPVHDEQSVWCYGRRRQMMTRRAATGGTGPWGCNNTSGSSRPWKTAMPSTSSSFPITCLAVRKTTSEGAPLPAHIFEWGGYNADGTTWGCGHANALHSAINRSAS